MSENLLVTSPVTDNDAFNANTITASFAPGDVVIHKNHGYLGLIYDVDPVFSHSDDWYEVMAKSRPRKDTPWYHILVDGEEHTTYVPQANLSPFIGHEPEIDHPLVKQFFQMSSNGIFLARVPLN